VRKLKVLAKRIATAINNLKENVFQINVMREDGVRLRRMNL
jgi:hypothetical protein